MNVVQHWVGVLDLDLLIGLNRKDLGNVLAASLVERRGRSRGSGGFTADTLYGHNHIGELAARPDHVEMGRR